MKKHLYPRILSLVLAAVMILGSFPGINAVPAGLRWTESDVDVSWDKSDRLLPDEIHGMMDHKPTDMVRVSIVLEDTPTLKRGYSTNGISSNPDAMAYDLHLRKAQENLAETISTQALGGRELDVVWHLTLAVNIISANIPYGRIEAIKAVDGVKDVVLERRYEMTEAEKNTYSSAGMVGATTVWQTGLTGAGTRIAIIDTGTDTDHQSFDNGAYLHALRQNAAAKSVGYEAYVASLDLLDAAEIGSVLNHLNAAERVPNGADAFYINEKLPFGANYVDKHPDVTHDNDQQGSHGSHVAGIAAANRFLPEGGSYTEARESVRMSGVAPDAQIITMKVFGKNPGPSDSDYFAAIEDAILLGCDSVNLSLGSGSPGYAENYLFADLLDFMATTDTVVVVSAGNSGHWAEYTTPTNLYADGVSFQTNGSPGSYTNTLTVASVDNTGIVGKYIQVDDSMIIYTETEYSNRPIASLDTTGSGTEYDYIYIDGLGFYEDYDTIDLTGKVVFCQRGELSFAEKGNIAAELGAAAVIVYNTDEESFGMDLTDYRFTAPCVSIPKSGGDTVRAASTPMTTAYGMTYYTGKVTITNALGVVPYGSGHYTMSNFSSWGVPGSLELKPEITAPGGLIWSVNGVDPSADAYELMSGTSMAAPQVAGMAALVAEDIRSDNLLENQKDLKVRHLAQSLLMSTAEPMRDENGNYYSILNQGAGLARVDLATTSGSFIRMHDDGKVKAELGDDPARTGVYSFSFDIVNLDGKPLSYVLTADVFTQDLFSDENGYVYLDTKTRALPAVADFSVDGVSVERIDGFTCDLNGDGSTNTADADYLLEYLLGNEDKLHADGDVNGDGKVNSYDAHVLLAKQTGTYAVNVPANGHTSIEVTLKLTEEARAYLDAHYPTGAYVESFVYATPISGPEGEKEVTHSIPVLGYYGSWSEPSMYDVGSYLEYANEPELRPAYLYQINGTQSNFISILTDGNEYVFGGNPLIKEAEYLPHRNAFNNKNGALLNKLYYTQIRNAGNSMLLITNAETGEVYLSEERGAVEAAYYHINMGQWQNTRNRIDLGLDLADYPEGTRLNISLISAPEYYCEYDKEEVNQYGDPIVHTDWKSLAEGAYLTTPVTIDNTAPVIKDIKLNEQDNTLNITAQDGEYVAAVALMDVEGTTVITAAPANQTVKGAEITTALDLHYVFGEKFLVAVYDYAENVTVREIELDIDGTRPYFTAIDRSHVNHDRSINYIGMDTDGVVINLAPTSGRAAARAAEYVEGAVFEITDDNELYVGYDQDLLHMDYLCHLDPNEEHQIVNFTDIAFNRAEKKLYGLFYSQKNDRQLPYLTTIDLYTGKLNVLGEMPIDANSIAIDGEGNFYSGIYADAQLYTYTSDVVTTGNATLVGMLTGKLNGTEGYFGTSAINSMAWDHNTDELYWGCTDATFNSTILLKINPATARVTEVCQYNFLACGLYIAYEAEEDLFPPVDEVISVTTVPSATTLIGNTIQLSAQIAPWTASNKAVIWSSSDESIATVDENGLVSGISVGTAVITATSALDRGKYANCTVTINTLDKDLNCLVWDNDRRVWWSEFNTDTVPDYTTLADTDLPVNSTMVANGILYASTLDTSTMLSDLYTVDPETFEMTKVGGSPVIGYLDMAYGPNCGCGFGVYDSFIVLIDLYTGNYLGVFNWTEGIASDLVGITYYDSQYVEDMDATADFFLILDSDGNVYMEAILVVDGYPGYFYGPGYGYLQNIGTPVDYDYFQGFYFDGAFTYWTRFHEADNAVELIAWDTEDTGNVYSLGTFPEGIWPVAGLYSDADFSGTKSLSDGALSTASFKSAKLLTCAETAELARGSLNAVSPDSTATDENDDGTNLVMVEVTMPEDATNGIFTALYDTEKLICTKIISPTDVDANVIDQDAGTVTVAFADKNTVPAGEPVAYLFFSRLTNDESTTQLTISTTELNNSDYSNTEMLPITLPHICPSAHFADVQTSQWFHEAVDYVVSSGYMNGMDNTHFGPGVTMNRAQFVTVLYRMEDTPEVRNTGVFTDVDNGQFYTDAVYWALETGITTGTTATTFNPGAQLTRTELVTFMYRYARYKGYDTTAGDLLAYQDAGQVPSFATDAWGWSVKHGIVSGMTATTLAPMNLTNRAQAAAIFQRFDNAFI